MQDVTIAGAGIHASAKKLHHPPVAVLPLGTGNDLSRVLGWGGEWATAKAAAASCGSMDAGDSSGSRSSNGGCSTTTAPQGSQSHMCVDTAKEIFQQEKLIEGQLSRILAFCRSGTVTLLDRWRVEAVKGYVCGAHGIGGGTVQDCIFPNLSRSGLPQSKSNCGLAMVMNNYMGLGIDAHLALQFHAKREEAPGLFVSPTLNKLWYLQCVTLQVFSFLSHTFWRSTEDLLLNLFNPITGMLAVVPRKQSCIALEAGVYI